MNFNIWFWCLQCFVVALKNFVDETEFVQKYISAPLVTLSESITADAKQEPIWLDDEWIRNDLNNALSNDYDEEIFQQTSLLLRKVLREYKEGGAVDRDLYDHLVDIRSTLSTTLDNDLGHSNNDKLKSLKGLQIAVMHVIRSIRFQVPLASLQALEASVENILSTLQVAETEFRIEKKLRNSFQGIKEELIETREEIQDIIDKQTEEMNKIKEMRVRLEKIMSYSREEAESGDVNYRDSANLHQLLADLHTLLDSADVNSDIQDLRKSAQELMKRTHAFEGALSVYLTQKSLIQGAIGAVGVTVVGAALLGAFPPTRQENKKEKH